MSQVLIRYKENQCGFEREMCKIIATLLYIIGKDEFIISFKDNEVINITQIKMDNQTNSVYYRSIKFFDAEKNTGS